MGFLSVFKFGNRVIWKTNKNKGLLFEINYLDVVNIENISDYNVDIREIDNLSQGTEIEIELNDYSVKTLQEYFQNKKMMKKIIQHQAEAQEITQRKIQVEIQEITQKKIQVETQGITQEKIQVEIQKIIQSKFQRGKNNHKGGEKNSAF